MVKDTTPASSRAVYGLLLMMLEDSERPETLEDLEGVVLAASLSSLADLIGLFRKCSESLDY